jgi:hypothetical protein
MAKKDSGPLYLRTVCETNGSTYNSTNLDVSAYVDPLDGKVLRIKKVWAEWCSDNGGTITAADIGVDLTAAATAQLSTVSQDSLKPLTNSALFFKTQIYGTCDNTSGNNNITMMHEDNAMNPADFEDGFFVASDVIQLGVDSDTPHAFANDIECQILIEAERVKMSEKDAFAVISAQQQD